MINNIIKQRREELGLSQEYIAKAVGVSKATVSRWESGEIENLRRNRIYNLSKVLQISPNDLLCDDQELSYKKKATYAEDHDAPLLDVYHRLNARGQEKVLDYASDLAKSPDYTTALAHPYRIAARDGGIMDLTEEEYKRRQKELENAVVATPETHPWL